mmetsp:Transcript_10964/g.22849  ORF Transcript_10964/g.22849 Transcript_10964/m.22849 type:complete len:144 (-) Transcript_10964:848-1279(-)
MADQHEPDAPTPPPDSRVEGEPEKASDGGPGEISGAVSEEEMEDETCGFCKFMKAGPCGTVFKSWELCIDKHREDKTDFVESCLEPTKLLKECMERNPEYYAPVLDLEKEGEEQGEVDEQRDTADKTAAESESKDDAKNAQST